MRSNLTVGELMRTKFEEYIYTSNDIVIAFAIKSYKPSFLLGVILKRLVIIKPVNYSCVFFGIKFHLKKIFKHILEGTVFLVHMEVAGHVLPGYIIYECCVFSF